MLCKRVCWKLNVKQVMKLDLNILVILIFRFAQLNTPSDMLWIGCIKLKQSLYSISGF